MEMYERSSDRLSITDNRVPPKQNSLKTLFTIQHLISLLLLAFLAASEIRSYINEDARIDRLEEELKGKYDHQWKELKKDFDKVLIKRNHLKKPGN